MRQDFAKLFETGRRQPCPCIHIILPVLSCYQADLVEIRKLRREPSPCLPKNIYGIIVSILNLREDLDLIRADLRRILKKPGLYVFLTIACLIFMLWSDEATAAEQMSSMQFAIGIIGASSLIIPVFFAVYADDFRTGIISFVIGSGMPRSSYVLKKFFESALLFMGTMTVMTFAGIICIFFSDLAISFKQTFHFIIYSGFSYIKGCVLLAISALFLNMTWSLPAAITAMILFAYITGPVLMILQEVTLISVYDFYFEGLLDSSFNAFQAGKLPLKMIPVFLLLILILVITIKFFEKREL